MKILGNPRRRLVVDGARDLGKIKVSTLLMVAGLEVIDLGVDVPVEKFVPAAQDHKPDIVGLSALLSMIVPEQRQIIEALREKGLRHDVKKMVGGGSVSENAAKDVGATGYGSTTPNTTNPTREFARICERIK